MTARQLWLLPQPQPLRERFGDAFFKNVPAAAGVYLMRDARGRVVYAGQSANLRARLGSYKNVRPEREPRRLVRLVQSVASIDWELCDSPEAARIRENELLRYFRPRFNRVNTHPEAYGFIGMRETGERLELWLTQEMRLEEPLFGAFKGLRWTGYSSLLRLLVRVGSGARSAEQFPLRLLGRRPPRRFQLAVAPAGAFRSAKDWARALRSYLGGDSAELIDECERLLPSAESLSPFFYTLQSADLQDARDFFERGPKRNQELRRRHGVKGRLIPPAALDDLLALSSGGRRRPPEVTMADAGI